MSQGPCRSKSQPNAISKEAVAWGSSTHGEAPVSGLHLSPDNTKRRCDLPGSPWNWFAAVCFPHQLSRCSLVILSPLMHEADTHLRRSACAWPQASARSVAIFLAVVDVLVTRPVVVAAVVDR